MFNSAEQDRALLDCLDWLEQTGSVNNDLPGVVANDQPSPSDMRALLIMAADEKLIRLIYLARRSQLNSRLTVKPSKQQTIGMRTAVARLTSRARRVS